MRFHVSESTMTMASASFSRATAEIGPWPEAERFGADVCVGPGRLRRTRTLCVGP